MKFKKEGGGILRDLERNVNIYWELNKDEYKKYKNKICHIKCGIFGSVMI